MDNFSFILNEVELLSTVGLALCVTNPNDDHWTSIWLNLT